MSKFENFNEDAARVGLIEKIRAAKSCSKDSLTALENHLKLMSEYVKQAEDNGDYCEIFYELEDEIAYAINDSNFREDRIGANATSCAELFQMIYKYLDDDPNIEVILASNPNIPEDLTKHLIASESYWEEDGTQQALARNRSELWILEQLSKSGQSSVRYEVALNESTPPQILDSLAADIESCDWRIQEIRFGEVSDYRGFIRWAAIQNPNTDKATLQRLLNQEFESLGENVDSVLNRIAVELAKD
jgi:hypothetical protein